MCGTDLTNKVKVISYHCFPDKLWDEAQKDWAKNFQQLFNGAMCDQCAKEDLKTSHTLALRKTLKEPVQLSALECPKFSGWFGKKAYKKGWDAALQAVERKQREGAI